MTRKLRPIGKMVLSSLLLSTAHRPGDVLALVRSTLACPTPGSVTIAYCQVAKLVGLHVTARQDERHGLARWSGCQSQCAGGRVGPIVVITRLVVDFAASHHQRQKLLLKRAEIEQLHFASVHQRLERVVQVAL